MLPHQGHSVQTESEQGSYFPSGNDLEPETELKPALLQLQLTENGHDAGYRGGLRGTGRGQRSPSNPAQEDHHRSPALAERLSASDRNSAHDFLRYLEPSPEV